MTLNQARHAKLTPEYQVRRTHVDGPTTHIENYSHPVLSLATAVAQCRKLQAANDGYQYYIVHPDRGTITDIEGPILR